MFISGIWVDVGLDPVFRAMRQDLSEWASPMSLRLFIGDDTPTTTWVDTTPVELANDSYAPAIVDLTHQQGHITPPPPYWSWFGATFDLAPPSFGNDTIYGWYAGPIDPSSGYDYLIAAGRFDPPIIIPPAGMTLTIDELRIYLHDCGTSPPPPPGPASITDTLNSPNGSDCSQRVPQVGPAWFYQSGPDTTWSISGGYATFTGGAISNPLWSTLDTADMTGSTVMNLGAVGAGISGLAFRLTRHDTFYVAGLLAPLLFRLYKCVAGVFTLLATAGVAYTPGSDATITVSASGSALSAVFNGTTTLTVTDASIPNGIGAGLYSDSTVAPKWKDFHASN